MDSLEISNKLKKKILNGCIKSMLKGCSIV